MEQDVCSSNEKRYLTQTEVADRFRVTPSTVKNWREKGLLKFLRLPGSTRVLYPIEAVWELEEKYIIKEGKEVTAPKDIRRKRPEASTIPAKEWRV